MSANRSIHTFFFWQSQIRPLNIPTYIIHLCEQPHLSTFYSNYNFNFLNSNFDDAKYTFPFWKHFTLRGISHFSGVTSVPTSTGWTAQAIIRYGTRTWNESTDIYNYDSQLSCFTSVRLGIFALDTIPMPGAKLLFTIRRFFLLLSIITARPYGL